MTTTSLHMDGTTTDGAAAHLLPRIGARLVDALLLAALGVALGNVIGFGPVWLALHALVVFAYFVVQDVVAGTTVGKRVTGLKVIGADGGNPTLRDAAVRESFTLLGAVPFVGPLLAAGAWVAIVATAHASPTGQGIHDRLASGTRVTGA